MRARSLLGIALTTALATAPAAADPRAAVRACVRACRHRPATARCMLGCLRRDPKTRAAGLPALFAGDGLPLDGMLLAAARGDTADLERFVEGQATFVEVESLPTLGPLFNGRSCAACHFQPALGGSGEFINEMRVRNDPTGGPVHIFASDNLLRAGPQTQAGLTIFPGGLAATPLGCPLTAPGCTLSPCQQEEVARTTFSPSLPLCDPTSARFAAGENCTAERQASALFGLGLVEAVADATFQTIAARQPAALRGVVKTVVELGRPRVARFGWKDDVATLRGFAGQAYLQEMGVTNPDHPHELTTCALGRTQFGVLLDAADDPEDATDAQGRADIDRFADFMRALAPPPTLPMDATARLGRRLFTRVGCVGCHVPALTTASDPAAFIPPTSGGVAISPGVNRLLAARTFHPYSDFLLHDMGSLGDGITSGVAGPTLMRTAPLWGVRAKSRFLHDGRAPDLATAIALHDGQGAAAAAAFAALTAAEQQALIAFLGTL
jgi:mono/diheme cytochrome c family protein